MDPDRQQRVRAVFDDVVAQAADADRQARLDALTAGEPDVRAAVAQLLAAHDAAGSFLEDGPGAARLDDPGPDVLGRLVGPYEVIREIGRGGMGTVFLGVRADDQYRKEVAIKVVRAAATPSNAEAGSGESRFTMSMCPVPSMKKGSISSRSTPRWRD